MLNGLFMGKLHGSHKWRVQGPFPNQSENIPSYIGTYYSVSNVSSYT